MTIKNTLSYFQLGICCAAFILGSCSADDKKQTPQQAVQAYLEGQTDSLDLSLQELLQAVEKKESTVSLQEKFEKARICYKHLEPVTELYFPGFSETINGPAIDEEEAYEGKVTKATGFQVVEEYLYPEIDTSLHDELLQETRLLASTTNRLRQLVKSNELTDQHVFQAMRLELLRIMALGISGFDSPIAQRSLPEAVAALRGVEKILLLYKHSLPEDKEDLLVVLTDMFDKTCSDLTHPGHDFNTFDRAAFITEKITPLSESVYAYQQALGIANRDLLSAVNLENTNFFDTGTYQIRYFANPGNRDVKPEMINLGRLLFFDPVLSGNNKRACASCHQPSKAFTDGRAKSLAFEASGEVNRNAPTLINAAYQRMQFYDSRVMFQEDQVTEVMANPSEMHGHIDEAVNKIRKSEAYQKLFREAYGLKDDQPVTNRLIQMALASYIRSLSSMSSPFDLYMRGDKSKMSNQALAGFNLFMGKAKCGTCHFMPLFNGTVPPMFTKSESEVLGVPQKPDTAKATADPDAGKFLAFGGELNKNAFKTPTVRNIALTAPYMHNGVYHTLEEVIDFYNRGGGAGIGIELPNQTLPPDKLNLSAEEQQNIIAFIHSLTDTTGLTTVPKELPRFNDAVLDKRKIGGEY